MLTNEMMLMGILMEVFLISTLSPFTGISAREENPETERARKILREVDDMWRGSSSHVLFSMRVKTAHYERNM